MTDTILKLIPKEKICNACKVAKPLSGFQKNCRNKDGVLNRCADCTNKHRKESGANNAYYKRWRASLKKNPERYKKYIEQKNTWNRSEKYFDSYFKRKFNISLKEVNNLLFQQNGLCANIGCSRSIAITPEGEISKAVVDHDHSTSKVRAMMCVRCNSLLGHIENSMGVIRGLMDYLNKYK